MGKERDLVRMIIREMVSEAVALPRQSPADQEKKGSEKEDPDAVVLAEILDLTGDIKIPYWLSTLVTTVLILAAVIMLVVFGPELLLTAGARAAIAAFFADWLAPGLVYTFRAYFAGRFGMLMGYIAISIDEDDEKKFWLGVAGILLLGVEVLTLEAMAISAWLRSAKGAKQLADARALVEITDNGFKSAAKMSGAMTAQGVLVSQMNRNEDFIAERVAIHLADFFGRDTKNIFARDYDMMIDELVQSEEDIERASRAYDDAIMQAAKDLDSLSKLQKKNDRKEEIENKYYEKSYDETR